MTDGAAIVLHTDTWTPGVFSDRDGSRWTVEGSCETERCGAVCCKVADWTGKVGERCEMLQADLRCYPHAKRGPACKPTSCLLWPLRPADVAKVNELAERFGFTQRCLLKVIRWRR